jgi:histone acetyltransferase
VKGYGTRLMNKFKGKLSTNSEEMQRKNIEYLMTYADNFALGYFRKQGFTKDYRMAPERWKGYIKDYEGGTMMECYIHPRLDYSRVSEIIKQQKSVYFEINSVRYR